MQATMRDLRLRTQELLAATARGEEVEITYRGRRCARLSAWEGLEVEETAETEEATEHNPLFGLWRDREECSVDELVRGMRQPRIQEE